MPNPAEVEEALASIGERDHTATAEYRIFGPPGTGKTTSLTRQIKCAVSRFGKDSVLVTSFSRAAAAELVGRDLPLSSDRIGTLHSHCWHALGKPRIAEVHVADWNKENPHFRIIPAKGMVKLEGEESGEEFGDLALAGDLMLSELNRVRGMLLPESSWPANLRGFARRWHEHKTAHGLLDFCDLIEIANRDLRFAPLRPSVVFADEAQDLNPMQLKLVRQWGEHADYFVIAADDDQTIYSWCGASSDAVLDPEIPEDHKIILRQSYRVPRAVHEVANRLIHQVTRRQEKLYDPRPEDGLCMHLSSGGYKSTEYWILKTILQHIETGETVMLLAACSYMLEPVIAVLRKEGIPFHNPYRKSQGYWNPLNRGSKGAASRLAALFGPLPWTHGALKRWADCLRPGVLRPGAKELIDAADDSLPVYPNRIMELFAPSAADSLLEAVIDEAALMAWFAGRIVPEFHTRLKYPFSVVRNGGPAALTTTPMVIPGTIHSVKGGEADAVFLFPDLSRSGDLAYQRYGTDRDAVLRLFYVGMTRARKALYICERETSIAVTL